jgi:hypothetical protein
MDAIFLNNIPLVLPKGLELEWEENNSAFDSGFENGSITLPVELPIKGNELALGFASELDSSIEGQNYEGLKMMSRGNLQAIVSMKVMEVNYPDTISLVFVATNFFIDHGSTLLNEIGMPNITLGANDTEVLAAMKAAKDGSELYCFPPVSAPTFYDGKDGFSTNVNTNFYEIVSNLYETNSDYSKPVVPFFFLTKLVRYVFETLGYTVKGSFFYTPEFQQITISLMASMDLAKNPNDFKDSNENVPNASQYIRAAQLWNGAPSFPAVNGFEVVDGLPFLFSYQMDVSELSNDVNGDPSKIKDWKIIVSYGVWDGLNDSSKIVFDSNEHSQESKLFQIPMNAKITKRVAAVGGTDGPYFFIHAFGYEIIANRWPGGIFNPNYNPGYSTILFTTPMPVPINSIEVEVRYLGANGAELLDGQIDFSYHMPSLSIGDFLNDLRDDFNLCFDFSKKYKQVEVYLPQDRLNLPVKNLDSVIKEEYRHELFEKEDSYSFKQDFTEENGADLFAELNGKQSMGSYSGIANLPDAEFNVYVVEQRSNLVYISLSTVAGSGIGDDDYYWEPFVAYRPTANRTIGNTVKKINANFDVLDVIDTAGVHALQFNGVGKTRYLGNKGSDRFTMANFFVSTGNDAPIASVSEFSFAGVQTRALLLSYAAERSNSIYGFCWNVWLDFLAKVSPVEFSLINRGLQEDYNFESLIRFKGRLFMAKQYRKREGTDGAIATEFSAYRIK